MARILSLSELESYNKEYLAESNQLIKSKVFSRDTASQTRKNIFVSYSSKDKKHLPYIIKVIEGHGGTPYIDEGDARLPKPPSVQTAKILKNAIISCKRLIVFVTINSKDSKWIPWELGIGDGAKGNYDIAIFPAGETKYDTTWLEQEYLGLYRRIAWGKINGYKDNMWIVFNYQKNTAEPLSEWINGT